MVWEAHCSDSLLVFRRHVTQVRGHNNRTDQNINKQTEINGGVIIVVLELKHKYLAFR